MPGAPQHSTPRLDRTPLEIARDWPADRRLLMLHSARPHRRWGRTTVFGVPRATYRHDGRHATWIGAPPPELEHVRLTGDPLADLDAVLGATRGVALATAAPVAGGWLGMLSYDLGRVIEPAARGRWIPPDDRGWPLLELAWCPDLLVHDHDTGRWTSVGEAAPPPPAGAPAARPFVGDLTAGADRRRHVAAVERTKAYIAAGDIYQANITQRLTAPFVGSPRHAGLALLGERGSWFGGVVELSDGRVLVSLSPELLLDVDGATRWAVTRPIKGTRPATIDPRELERSPKDAAELHMIVDLARNDLGRVCEPGSVRVERPRRVESHPTVHHGVADIAGRLRADVSPGQVLAAVFPAGSVTGAPKIRAMQIIDELEPVRRGPYCGSIAWFGDGGRITLNVAIRTLCFTPEPTVGEGAGWTLDYGVGGGIVADSDPEAEFLECLDKAAVVRDG